MCWEEVQRRLRALPEPKRAEERVAAVLLLLVPGDNGPELVLEVRSYSLKRQPGEICLPGGGLEPGETAEQCALRETREELGLEAVTLLAHVESFRHVTGERVEVFAGTIDSLSGLRPQKSEVEEVFTVPLRWFREQPSRTAHYVLTPDWTRSSEELRSFLPWGRESSSPLWVYDGRVIWGMTARVVERFLAVLETVL